MSEKRRGSLWLLGCAVIVFGLAGSYFFWAPPKAVTSSAEAGAPATEPAAAGSDAGNKPRVETVRAAKGGLVRTTTQPGSAHSFESAELFAKVSGYLQAQHVDIGSYVKRGQLLAEIDVPELSKDVDAATATCQQALAEVAQSEARVEAAILDHKAAEARIEQARADLERWQSDLQLAHKQHDRIRELNQMKGIEARIVDEKQHQVQSTKAGEHAARVAVAASVQQAAAAESRVALAKADLRLTQAKVAVAEAACERAKVMASYTRITSPYDGVVTCRNFHRGAYVRSPDQGGQVPLLSVDRRDLMRVVVRIPEREIPYVHVGDKAVVEFDALPNRRFETAISRIGHGEDARTRTMIAEIDLPNKDDLLRDHMYGRVEIELEEASEGLRIPSACLVGNVTDGKARVFVVQDGEASLRDIQVGKDTGATVEVFSGLTEADEIIIRPPGGLADGARVVSKPMAEPEARGGGGATGKSNGKSPEKSTGKSHGGSASR